MRTYFFIRSGAKKIPFLYIAVSIQVKDSQPLNSGSETHLNNLDEPPIKGGSDHLDSVPTRETKETAVKAIKETSPEKETGIDCKVAAADEVLEDIITDEEDPVSNEELGEALQNSMFPMFLPTTPYGRLLPPSSFIERVAAFWPMFRYRKFHPTALEPESFVAGAKQARMFITEKVRIWLRLL